MTSVYESFGQIIFISRYLLFSSLSYPPELTSVKMRKSLLEDENRILQLYHINFIDVVVYSLGILVSFLVLILNIFFDVLTAFKNSLVVDLFIIFVLFTLFLIKLMLFVSRKRIWVILPKIHHIDNELLKLGIILDFKMHLKVFNLFAITALILYHFALLHSLYMFMQMSQSILYDLMTFYVLTSTLKMILLLYGGFTLELFFRFLAVNNFIRKSFTTDDDSTDKTILIFYLQKLAHLHNELNVLIEDYVNFLFSIPALGLAFLVFLLSVLNFYLLYLDLTDQLLAGSILVTNFMVWYAYIVSLSMIAIGVLTICENELKYTHVALCRAACNTNEGGVMLRIVTFMEQIQIRNERFTCGMFEFTFNWLLTVLAATLVYVLILVQMI